MATGQMLPYLHFTRGDILWLAGWVPTSVGAVVGACVGLFLLALCERWIAAMRAVMEVHWQLRCVDTACNCLIRDFNSSRSIVGPFRSRVALSNKHNSIPSSVAPKKKVRWALLKDCQLFVPAHDYTRGVLQIAQSAFSYLMMLAFMCVA